MQFPNYLQKQQSWIAGYLMLAAFIVGGGGRGGWRVVFLMGFVLFHFFLDVLKTWPRGVVGC